MAGFAGPLPTNAQTLEPQFSVVVALASFVVPRPPADWVLKNVGIRVFIAFKLGECLAAVSLSAFEGSHQLHAYTLASMIRSDHRVAIASSGRIPVKNIR
jgi:hypothetical protein